jgi:O-methyltransferase
MIRYINKLIKKAGYIIVNVNEQKRWPSDFDDLHKTVISKVLPYTMTSRERLYGLMEAICYISKYKIEGDIVECGVWKGGSMLAVAEVLLSISNTDRQLFLYDTFEGMPPPGEKDLSFDNRPAEVLLNKDLDKENNLVWAYSTLNDVKRTMSLCNYPASNIHYIKGKVEETIPGTIPKKIALLRLDTDWYESTKHELKYLFPLLEKAAVIIIDDYGFWKGARKAVDEYIKENNIQILLNRLDETGRIAIKQ